MDFICLEAGLLSPPFAPILTQDAPWTSGDGGDFLRRYPHLLPSSSVIKKESAWAQMSVSGKWVFSSPVPSHLPCSLHVQCFLPLASLPFWLSYQQHFSSQDPNQVPPLLDALQTIPSPWTAPFPGLPQPNFRCWMSVIHRYYPWIPHWLAKCAIMTLKLECRLPKGRRDTSFTPSLTVVYIRLSHQI